MAERLWVKLWRSWWTGESHVDVSADALNIGVVLMSFTRWEPGDDEGWAVTERGRPIPTSVIAGRARWKTNRAATALRELEDAGTVVLRSDGAWGFPKFGVWQETAELAAERRRDARKGTHWVYFATDTAGLIKIGCSANPWARVADLSIECKQKVSLLAKERGEFARERELHARFSDLRVRGEWFRNEEPLCSYVASIRSTTGRTTVATTKEVEVEADVALRESIVPFGDSPQRSEPNAGAEPERSPVAQILTHPTADAAAGRVVSQRRRAAVELWDWHEGERVRRLLAGSHKPRCATDKSLGPVLRLHTHVRKAYQCSEAEAWAKIRAYREARLAETEAALREGNPKAEQWRSYAAGEAAWSHKGFDYLEQRGPDPRAAKAAADAEFAAEVQRRKAAARSGGGDG